MLEFFSSSTRVVNSRHAIQGCLGAEKKSGLIMIHASIGHLCQVLKDEVGQQMSGVRVVGAFCCGIASIKGVSESMKGMVLMAVRGPELTLVHVEGIDGHSSFEKVVELARQLKAQQLGISIIHFLAAGIDGTSDPAIAGIESVLCSEAAIFGATSYDHMRSMIICQIVDEPVLEQGAPAGGFADPYQKATCGDSIPLGALAEHPTPKLVEEHGNPCVLWLLTKQDADGVMHYFTMIGEGARLSLTVRNEERIIAADMECTIVARAGWRKPPDALHADCLARGGYRFNCVIKEELVGLMQLPLSRESVVPPWLGMYEFGEFSRLLGVNTCHKDTTAIYRL